MGLPLRRYRVVGHAGLALLLLAAVKAQAASSVLIWPIDPVLEADQQASALWLENRGSETANLQIRVFGWSQSGFAEQYQNQRDVIGSPPVAKIEPGQKQLVRLTRTREVPPGQELAYRIIIDEIPSAQPATADGGKTAAAIRFFSAAQSPFRARRRANTRSAFPSTAAARSLALAPPAPGVLFLRRALW